MQRLVDQQSEISQKKNIPLGSIQHTLTEDQFTNSAYERTIHTWTVAFKP
jgi:hypothetical protein